MTQLESMADAMGIALYDRFSEKEAAIFLGVTVKELTDIRASGVISYVQVTPEKVSFFAFQLLEYISDQTVSAKIGKPSNQPSTDRILRIKEVVEITGLSRSTIWRREQDENSDFPKRISLGVGSVGWRASDIEAWVRSR